MSSAIIDRFIFSHLRRIRLSLQNPGTIISMGSYVDGNSKISVCCTLINKSQLIRSTIGRFTRLSGARVSHTDCGSFCSLASGARIGGQGNHPLDQLSTHRVFFKPSLVCKSDRYSNDLPRVQLGHDVWVGTQAIIRDGLTVGTGAVVAAGAVVTKPVPPYAIVGGVPARVLRYRFDPSLIDDLLASHWWDWNDAGLRLAANAFNPEVPLTLESFRELCSAVSETQEPRNKAGSRS